MIILQIDKFFYLHGGASRYFFELTKLLQMRNHQVAFLSMQDKKNYPTEWDKYFVSNMSFESVSLPNSLSKLCRMIYSLEAKQKIHKLLQFFLPDVCHIHGLYHHISPSILPELKKRGIPIIQTVHDYHLIAPNYNLFHDGKICETTKKTKFYSAILHKCVKDSYLASFAEVLEKYIYLFLGWERKYIDYFIAPSRFMKDKLIEYGIPDIKIVYLSHFIRCKNYVEKSDCGQYVLYFGRLSPEKGIDIIINAMKRYPKIPLKIVGRGNKRYELKLKRLVGNAKNIQFVGFREGFKLNQLINGSRFTVLSSLWHEVSPMSILESFAFGKPVIASEIGGIPELIQDEHNGLLFEPGNIEDCAEKISRLWNNPKLCRQMGQNAREYVERNFGPEEHYEKLMGIYKRAIEKHR